MSTILEREQKLIQTMKQQDFQKFFDGDSNDAYEVLESSLFSLVDYQNTVIRMTSMMTIWRARYDGQELRDRITDIDQRRRIAHEHAITNCNILNRVCDAYGVEPIVDIDTSDRYQVADFAGKFCAEVYEAGKSKPDGMTADKLLELRGDRRDEYDKSVISERIHELDAKFGHLSSDHTQTTLEME